MKPAANRTGIFMISVLIMLALPSEALAVQEKTYTVSIKNDQVFLNGKQLSKSVSKKSCPVLSPDKKKIAFKCTGKEGIVQIGTVDTGTKTEKLIKIDRQFDQIMNIQWLSNRRIGIEVHINPSLDSFQIYDAVSGKNIKGYYGYGFLFNKTKSNVIYMSAPPHFSSQLGEYAVMLDDAVLYRTDRKTALDSLLYPTKSFEKVAFYEYIIEEESKPKSNIVRLTIESNKVKSKRKIAWNKDMSPLKWDNEDLLSIGDIARYDMKKL